MTPGQKFGEWTVLGSAGSDRTGAMLWAVVCSCGRQKNVRRSALLRGRTTRCQSCANTRSNTTHGQHGTPLYGRWQGMHKRTRNPRERYYPNYGGRGITVCDRWHTFENFAADMGPTFSTDLELDRIDNDGPYSPENCRWATRSQQQRNRRDNRILTHAGRSQTVADWADEIGIKSNTLHTRLYKGLPVESVLREVLG